MKSKRSVRAPVVLKPGAGRKYKMGRITSVFKADLAETKNKYSVSEWWLEPNTTGPGPHSHDEDDLFFVIEGTMSFLLGEKWIEAPKGTFILAPGGVIHDFQNRSDARAGALNFSAPGGFEDHMPGIVKWFKEHSPGDIK